MSAHVIRNDVEADQRVLAKPYLLGGLRRGGLIEQAAWPCFRMLICTVVMRWLAISPHDRAIAVVC
jgi:hypothetical protein